MAQHDAPCSNAVLEIHYLRPPDSPNQRDSSGVIMHLTRQHVPFAAGIAMFVTVRLLSWLYLAAVLPADLAFSRPRCSYWGC